MPAAEALYGSRLEDLVDVRLAKMLGCESQLDSMQSLEPGCLDCCSLTSKVAAAIRSEHGAGLATL